MSPLIIPGDIGHMCCGSDLKGTEMIRSYEFIEFKGVLIPCPESFSNFLLFHAVLDHCFGGGSGPSMV